MFTTSYINEIWKPVRGYEGWYEVSNFGRVKSLERTVKKGRGKGLHTLPEKIRKQVKANKKANYLYVSLCKNGTLKTLLVHRLVWEAFNCSIPEGFEISHLDENPENNCLDNLSLMTHKENINWGTHNKKLAAANQNHPSYSKPVLQYAENEKLIAMYPSLMEGERQTGINNSSISSCCLGKRKTAGGFIWKYAD